MHSFLFVSFYPISLQGREDVTLPASLTSVGRQAFNSCGAMKTVKFNGTEKQWNAISFWEQNEDLTNTAVTFAAAKAQAGLDLRNGSLRQGKRQLGHFRHYQEIVQGRYQVI